MTFHLRVMYQVAIGWRWGSTPPWSAFWPWHFLNQLKPFWGSKHVLFELVFAKRHFTRHTWQELVFAKRHFTRHTWQSTFSFSLSCKTAFHQAYLTKHVLFQLAFAKKHFTRPTWQTCSLLQTGILSVLLDEACSLSACFLQNGISPRILDKACSLLACFCKTALHQAYLTKMTKYVLF